MRMVMDNWCSSELSDRSRNSQIYKVPITATPPQWQDKPTSQRLLATEKAWREMHLELRRTWSDA